MEIGKSYALPGESPPRAGKLGVDEASSIVKFGRAGHAAQAGDDAWATSFNLLKAIMGAGGFALPWAFARMGLVAGCAALGSLTVRELSALRRHAESQQPQRRGVTYVDVAEMAFGACGARIVYALSLACSLGVTSAYLIFVATTLHSLAPAVSQGLLIIGTAALVLPVTWLRDFSLLSRIAQGGTAAVVVGYVVTVGYAVLHAREDGQHGAAAAAAAPPLPLVRNWASVASGFGPVAFLFCVHFLLFPVMAASRSSAHVGGFERLALATFCAAGVVNAAFAAACLLCFRGGVSSIVVNDIAGGTWYLTATKLLLCVDLFCSYPLVFAAGRQIAERSILGGAAAGECTSDEEYGGTVVIMGRKPITASRKRCMVRSLLVLVTVLLAQARDFGTIISLVGGFAQVTLAFVLPPLMALRLLGKTMAPGRRLLNMVILPIGVVVAVLATGTTLAEALGVKLTSH